MSTPVSFEGQNGAETIFLLLLLLASKVMEWQQLDLVRPSLFISFKGLWGCWSTSNIPHKFCSVERDGSQWQAADHSFLPMGFHRGLKIESVSAS